MATSLHTAPHHASGIDTPRYVRKAWRVLIGSFLIFTLLVAGTGLGVVSYLWNATRLQTGTVERIFTGTQATQASVRPRQQIGYKVLVERDAVEEGDVVRTSQDTRVVIRLFDQTTVELSGGSELLFEQLRTPQYFDRRTPIILKQLSGRVTVTTSPATGFAGTNLEVRTNSGGVEARQPSTRFRVLALPAQDTTARETMSVSVLAGASVIVTGTGAVQEQVTVGNGEQSVVTTGAAPLSPELKQRELVANGAFRFASPAEMGKSGSHWVNISNDGADGPGKVRGQAELVPEMVRASPTTALHIVRAGGNVDNEQVGFRQTFTFGELDEFDSVTLSADVKVLSHNLAGGGERGSEYPLILLLRYKDANGDPKDVGHGFFVQNEAKNPVINDTDTGYMLQPGVWTPHSWELRSLVPAPYRLVQLDVYASGHDFDAYVANISIVAK